MILKTQNKTVWDLYARGISYIRSIMKHTNDKAVLDKYLQEIIATFYRSGNTFVMPHKLCAKCCDIGPRYCKLRKNSNVGTLLKVKITGIWM